MAEELKPCPFCGSEPYVHEPYFKGDDWQIGCGDDHGEGGVFLNGETWGEAAERWNRRAAPVEPDFRFRIAWARLISMMGYLYGTEGFPAAPSPWRALLIYVLGLGCGTDEWERPDEGDWTEEERRILDLFEDVASAVEREP